MSVFLHATIKVRPGMTPAFIALMTDLKPALMDAGWTLRGAYITMIGTAGTVIQIWEMADFNAHQAALGVLSKRQDWPEISHRMHEIVQEDTVSLMVAAPYFQPAEG